MLPVLLLAFIFISNRKLRVPKKWSPRSRNTCFIVVRGTANQRVAAPADFYLNYTCRGSRWLAVFNQHKTNIFPSSNKNYMGFEKDPSDICI
ncbi:hypothetical protein BIW11_03662 [Tropilaelaps mercedesae]|uniref:Secreted protein n=1 Tax=Tropilaelaps mercedesae TaxID=418985 RepID=A0A1V9XHS8_9ACAR|nr:hypothetical protein BIW11_03662 [Tropilaelaps mercedesae]